MGAAETGSAGSPASVTTPRSRKFRFGLRTLIVVITAVCLTLGLGLYRAREYDQRKRRAEQMIGALNGTIQQAGWSDQPSPGSNWIASLFGFGEPRESRWIVSLSGATLTPQQVEDLGQCSWIRKLDLSNTNVDDKSLDEIAKIAKLRELTLAGTQVSDVGIEKLKQLEWLIVLNVSGTRVTYAGLAQLDAVFPDGNFQEQLALAKLSKTQNLQVAASFTGFSNDLDIFPPPRRPRAEFINLDSSSIPALSEDDISDLRRATSAKNFRLQGKSLPKGGLAFLADLPNLEQVAIYDTKTVSIHNDDLKTLVALPKLKKLTLYGNELTNDGCSPLAAAHQVESLSIHGYQLTPQLLVHLRDLKGLKQLDLNMWNHRANNEYIEDPTPEELAAAREGVKNLTAISNLESLSVMGNLMVDDVVLEFAEIKTLTTLTLDGRYSSEQTAQRIQEKLPACKIVRTPAK